MPVKGAAEDKEDPFEAPENLDKNRTICVDMLSNIQQEKHVWQHLFGESAKSSRQQFGVPIP
ncbi:hypothetical protein P3T76_013664 [Phytophthora citrophthora]|uniref:Uncharacterized protein n=1 Tax=Phytophthora citrophthora TaxID=4793 RepID=A0AAD9G2D6_9STRA|nr:hypothetical protein P3T76_013664 [Phytophthora citrophthora]